MRAESRAINHALQILRSPFVFSAPVVSRSLVWPFSSVASTLEKVLPPRDAIEVLRNHGCTDADISKILLRQPSLARCKVRILESKLGILHELGIYGANLVKVISCRPRFLLGRLGEGLGDRIQYLQSLFGSREMLLKAIIRNPSMLNYDVEECIKPCVALYENMGVTREQLALLLVSRPMILPRSSFSEEKLEFVQRTGLSKDSKMYKYVVSIVAVSHLDTIRKKVTNFDKFGFSAEDVMGLFARSPYVLTLSVDKVQRNMTYLLGTMKLPAATVLSHPHLLYGNLETVLKPRFLLAKKIQAMGVEPQIMPLLVSAMRMTEARFLRAFVTCHCGDTYNDLEQSYSKLRSIKRLAQDSKMGFRQGFPF